LGWSRRFKQRGFELEEDVEHILHSSYFKPTEGVTSVAAIFRGWNVAGRRTTENIRWHAERIHKLVTPSIELGCLLFDAIGDNGFLRKCQLSHLSVMHEPIVLRLGGIPSCPAFLHASKKHKADSRLEVGSYLEPQCGNKPTHVWPEGYGFAFEKL
jgi:hypothetical protein